MQHGSYTVGQTGSGADYANWTAAFAAVTYPLDGDLTFTQIDDTNDSAAVIIPAGDFAGWTLKLTSNLPHGGSVSGGHTALSQSTGYSFSSTNFYSSTGSGKLIIEHLVIRKTSLTTGGGITLTPNPSSGVGVTMTIRDTIIDCRTLTALSGSSGVMINCGTAGLPRVNTAYVYNCVVLGVKTNSLTASGIWVTAGGAASALIENCWVQDGGGSANGSCFANNVTYGQVTFRNNVAIGWVGAPCYRNISACSGVWSCMSTDDTADDGLVGSGNIINITVTTEFVSGTPADATFMKPLSDRAKHDGTAVGSGIGNDHGCILTIARPHTSGALTKYSIGPREWPSTAVITSGPTTQTVNEGAQATFAVTATDVTGYQWQVKPYGGAWGNVPVGGTGSSYQTPATGGSDHLAQYRCQVSNDGGTVTSPEVYLLLNGWEVPWGGGSAAPDRPVVTVTGIVDQTIHLQVSGVADKFRAELTTRDGTVVGYAERTSPGELTIPIPNVGVLYSLSVIAANVSSPPVWSLPGLTTSLSVNPPAPASESSPGVGISPTPSTKVALAGPLGSGFAFPFRFSPTTGAPEISYGVDHVVHCMRQVLGTKVGERVIRRDFGCPVARLLFAPDTEVGPELSADIQSSLATWEHRSEVLRVILNRDRTRGSISANIHFRTFQTHQNGNFVYPFNMEV